jgi:hypothetical protein
MRDFVIIAGTEKSGTTSLFNYLGFHEDIRLSKKKETNYFRGVNCTYDKYMAEFGGGEARVLLEASPGYLAESERVAGNIRATIPADCKIKLIFILRNPVERFISSYYFFREKNYIDEDIGLETFFDLNYRYYKERVIGDRRIKKEWFVKTYEQGLYFDKLLYFSRQFSDDEIRIIWFEDFKKNPGLIVSEILEELGLNKLDNQDYFQYNSTTTPRFKLLHNFGHKLNSSLEYFFIVHPKLKASLKKIYLKLNGKKPVQASPGRAAVRIAEHYKKDFADKWRWG